MKDGVVTPFGWASQIGEFFVTALTGAASGMAAWWAAGMRSPPG